MAEQLEGIAMFGTTSIGEVQRYQLNDKYGLGAGNPDH
jgi:hypothetical protein